MGGECTSELNHYPITLRKHTDTQIQPTRMRECAADPELMATDVVECIVLRGVPFRRAHEIVARALQQARESGVSIAEMPLLSLAELASQFDQGFYELFEPLKSALSKVSPGGTGGADLKAQTLLKK